MHYAVPVFTALKEDAVPLQLWRTRQTLTCAGVRAASASASSSPWWRGSSLWEPPSQAPRFVTGIQTDAAGRVTGVVATDKQGAVTTHEADAVIFAIGITGDSDERPAGNVMV